MNEKKIAKAHEKSTGGRSSPNPTLLSHILEQVILTTSLQIIYLFIYSTGLNPEPCAF
jgi:hypothetical protein